MVAVGGEVFTAAQRHTGGHSLSLVGRGFFSFVSVFFSFVLSKRLISVMSGLSDILAVRNEVGEKKNTPEHTSLTFSVSRMDKVAGRVMSHMISAAVT